MAEGNTYGLLLAMLDPPQEMEEEFNDWFERACTLDVKGIQGHIQSRRFSKGEGDATDLALIEFEEVSSLESGAYRTLMFSDRAVKARKAFGEVLHKIYVRYSPAPLSG